MPGEYSYGKNLLIAMDQLVNAVFNGFADETISSRAYRWDRDGVRSWPHKAIDLLFFWQKDHCRTSYESECLRMQLPPEMRE